MENSSTAQDLMEESLENEKKVCQSIARSLLGSKTERDICNIICGKSLVHKLITKDPELKLASFLHLLIHEGIKRQEVHEGICEELCHDLCEELHR